MPATATRTSRKLPAGWRQAGPGRAIHDETGTEVKKGMCGWSVTVPQRPGRQCPPRNVSAFSDFFTTRAAAIEAAETRAIPRTRTLIADCWDKAHAADTARTALIEARRHAAKVDAARFTATRPASGWAAVEQRAKIAVDQAKMALDQALGDAPAGWVRFVMVEVTYDEGGTWDVISWGRSSTEPSETPSAQALRYALASGLGPDIDRPVVPRAWRVRVWSNPSAEHDGEWTNLVDPCAPGEHDAGDNKITAGEPRTDGSAVEHACCARCVHGVWRVAPAGNADPGPWVLEGDPLPQPTLRLPVACLRTEHYGMQINIIGVWLTLTGVGPVDRETGDVELFTTDRSGTIAATAEVELRHGPGPDDDTQTPDPDPSEPACAADAAAGPDPAPLGYRIQTRTDAGWRTVRTGAIPPIFRPVPSGLAAAAETVLGNAGPVLGLGPADRLPNTRVQTWHRSSGRTASVTNTRR